MNRTEFFNHKPIWENEGLFSLIPARKPFDHFDDHTIPSSSFTNQGTFVNKPGISELMGFTNRLNQIHFSDVSTYNQMVKNRKNALKEIANTFINI